VLKDFDQALAEARYGAELITVDGATRAFAWNYYEAIIGR
jgi:hypothetical protein